MGKRKIHLIFERENGKAYFSVTRGLVMDSPIPILIKSYSPIFFKPENLKQLEEVYQEAKTYAEELARSENRQMSIPPPSPKAVLEEIARYAQTPTKCKSQSRKSSRVSGQEPYFGGSPTVSAMAPVDGNALAADY